MLTKILSALMMFAAGLFAPAVIAQAPHFHMAVVDEANRSVHTINVGWFVESGELLVSTATSRDRMIEFNWTEDDGTHHTLTTEAGHTKDWIFEITSITGLEAFEDGKIVAAPQGQGGQNGGSYRASWVDAQGGTHEVITPRTATSPAGRQAELNTHLEAVRTLRGAFPPRPVPQPPPPNDSPEPEALLYFPAEWNGLHATPKWHRPDPYFHRPGDPKFHRPGTQPELVGKWT